MTQPYGTSTLNREVERIQMHPLSWERGPMPYHWRGMLSCVRCCGAVGGWRVALTRGREFSELPRSFDKS